MKHLALLILVLGVFPVQALAAQLYAESPDAVFGTGDSFIVNVRVNNQDECINAVEAVITYPTDVLRAVDFSRGGSILSLWVQEPQIDTERGTITFAGGVPGGYCGRIQGDPSLSNMLGRIVFSVVDGSRGDVRVEVAEGSNVYLNDGLGTIAETIRDGALIQLQAEPTGVDNAWLAEVQADDIPPDPFTVVVQSTRGVFGGKYYIVFSTVDKQSGMSHYEVYERGEWKQVTSPHQLADQTLVGGIRVRAIDKAGNIRTGDYSEDSVPPRQTPVADFKLLIIAAGFLVLVGALKLALDRRSRAGVPPEPPPAHEA